MQSMILRTKIIQKNKELHVKNASLKKKVLQING